MKHLLFYLVTVIFLGSIFISCSEQQSPTAITNESITPISKVTVNEYFWEIVLDEEDPFVECDGNLMQYHGSVGLHIKEKNTPSGNIIANWWVDYMAFDGISLENLVTGEVWTLTNGHNPVGEVIKENGFYLIHYQWNELYKLDNKTLHVHLKGQFMVLPDGTVKHDQESVKCF
jgi:hypothetical protein